MKARLTATGLLFLAIALFYWKLTLSNEYTWLESPDFATQVVPWYQAQAEEWHAGRFPVWDPYHYNGQPFLGQTITGAAFPPNWILFNLPLRKGWVRQPYIHWYYVLLHYAGALFACWLCRDLGCSWAGSMLAGFLFAVGGWMGSTDWPVMLGGAIFGPAVLMFLLRLLRGHRPFVSAGLAGFFLGFAWLSGHHQIPIFLCLMAGGLWILHIARRGFDWKLVVAPMLIFVLLAAATGALQMLPALEYGKLAKRWIGMAEPVAWDQKVPHRIHQTYSLTPVSLIGIVFPGIANNGEPFMGWIAVALIGFGVATSRGRPEALLLGTIAALGFAYALGFYSIIHGVLYAVLPVIEKARSAGFSIYIFHLALCPLAAFGFDALRAPTALGRRFGLGILGVVGAAILAIWIMQLAGKADFDDRMLGGLLFLAFAGLLWTLWQRSAIGWRWFGPGFAFLMAMELSMGTPFLLPSRNDTNRAVFLNKMPQLADVVDFLRGEDQPVRVEVDQQKVPHNAGDFHGFEQYNGQLTSVTNNILRVPVFDKQTLDLFAVTHYIGDKPRWENQLLVFQSASGLQVYRNRDARPRAWVAHKVKEGVKDWQAEFQAATFDPASTVYIEGKRGFATEECGGDTVKYKARSQAAQRLSVSAACAGVLVIADTWFPGWQAEVDGKAAPVLEVDSALRGVAIGKGEHVVELRYKPASVRWGGALTAFGCLAALALALVSRPRNQ